MTDESTSVRRAEPQEAEAIYQLLVECGRAMTERGLRNWDPPPASADKIRGEIAADIVLVALGADGALLGSVTLRLVPTHEYGRDEAAGRVSWALPSAPARYMNRLAVHPARQGTGLGGRLMAESEAEARSAGAAALRFDVLAANGELVRWYERRGARVRGRRRHSGLDFVVMEKAL
ncbi:MAG TPA: GNAT family N-acetyltransferase [Longimicrobiales bacterium]